MSVVGRFLITWMSVVERFLFTKRLSGNTNSSRELCPVRCGRKSFHTSGADRTLGKSLRCIWQWNATVIFSSPRAIRQLTVEPMIRLLFNGRCVGGK